MGVPTLESPQGIKSEPKIAWMVAARKKTCDFVHVITRFLFFHGFVTLCKFIEVDWYGIVEKIGVNNILVDKNWFLRLVSQSRGQGRTW